MLHFRLHFVPDLSKFVSNFRKVVRQHTEGMMRSIICVLLEIYFSSKQWKNYKNLLRIDKVIAMSLVYYIFETPCSLKPTTSNTILQKHYDDY